jgi:hypothetical protein
METVSFRNVTETNIEHRSSSYGSHGFEGWQVIPCPVVLLLYSGCIQLLKYVPESLNPTVRYCATWRQCLRLAWLSQSGIKRTFHICYFDPEKRCTARRQALLETTQVWHNTHLTFTLLLAHETVLSCPVLLPCPVLLVCLLLSCHLSCLHNGNCFKFRRVFVCFTGWTTELEFESR